MTFIIQKNYTLLIIVIFYIIFTSSDYSLPSRFVEMKPAWGDILGVFFIVIETEVIKLNQSKEISNLSVCVKPPRKAPR